MFIYILNIIVILTANSITNRFNLSRKGFLKSTLLYLFFISSFRDKTMGADYIPYVSAFNAIRARGGYYMESGYVLLNKIVAIFTEHYAGVAIAVNLLLFVPLYHYIKKYVKEENWGLVVFVFAANPYMFIQTSFNAMRQACATGIILIGLIILLGNKNKLKAVVLYTITIFIAAQFHRIAYVMLFLPFVLNRKWKKKTWVFVFAASVIANVVRFTRIIEIFVSRLHLSRGYVSYEASMLNNPFYVIFIALVIMYLLYHYDDLNNLDDTTNRIINLYYFSLCFLIFAITNDMVYRVYMILAFCALPGISVVCENVRVSTRKIRIKNEHKVVQLLYFMYYFAFYIGYIGLLAVKGNSAYIPFKFFF